MAESEGNPLTDGASGKIGNIVFRHTKGGKTIMCKKPDFSNRQFSQGQLSHQERVKLAAAYGKVASKENPIYAKRAEGTDKNAYNIAFADAMKPPVLRGIEYFDGRLRVDVWDNVMVTKVTLTILDPEGRPLEQGDAELVYGVHWEYLPVNMGRILVQAWDLPGNMTEYEFSQPSENRYFWEQETGRH